MSENTDNIRTSLETINQDPQINMIPTTDGEISQLIVAEANYDRWSNFLFPHSKSNDIYGKRKRQWSVTLPDGVEKSAQIEVVPAQDEKSYTTKSYDVFLAVTEIWKSRDMTDEVMEIHLGDIAKILDLRENGRVVNMIMEELRCLHDTKVSWVFSFHSSETKEDTYKNQRVLDTFDYVQKSERNHGETKTTCSIRLSEHIRLNIKNKITVPVNFAARKKIRSSIAKALYSRLDNLLFHNPIYIRTALGLIEDLNVKPGRYLYKSQRKNLLQTLKKNLHGAEMSQIGCYIYVDIEETPDKKDWQCIFRTNHSSGQISDKSETIDGQIQHDDSASLFDMIEKEIGACPQYTETYQLLALTYEASFILDVIKEWKETTSLNTAIEDKQKYFVNLIHHTVHKRGLNWITSCGKQCPLRPENMLF
ncbi:hypothetical protein ACMUMQ_15580 [Marinomonas sp. 2405UD66-6]|uniref:hypothetical protein n=1 Tax=Marinomonas sp. 2405UD66-6 TaxID=3391834 RepID=UPI0039C8C7B2